MVALVGRINPTAKVVPSVKGQVDLGHVIGTQYSNFDKVLHPLKRISQLYASPHVPCDVRHEVIMLIGC